MARQKLKDLKAFKTWLEAADVVADVIKEGLDEIEKNPETTALGFLHQIARLSFRLNMTAENERRKKR